MWGAGPHEALACLRVTRYQRLEALDDKRVERGAAESNGEQQGNRLFADHGHGSFPLFSCGSGARYGEGEGGEGSLPGLAHHME